MNTMCAINYYDDSLKSHKLAIQCYRDGDYYGIFYKDNLFVAQLEKPPEVIKCTDMSLLVNAGKVWTQRGYIIREEIRNYKQFRTPDFEELNLGLNSIRESYYEIKNPYTNEIFPVVFVDPSTLFFNDTYSEEKLSVKQAITRVSSRESLSSFMLGGWMLKGLTEFSFIEDGYSRDENGYYTWLKVLTGLGRNEIASRIKNYLFFCTLFKDDVQGLKEFISNTTEAKRKKLFGKATYDFCKKNTRAFLNMMPKMIEVALEEDTLGRAFDIPEQPILLEEYSKDSVSNALSTFTKKKEKTTLTITLPTLTAKTLESSLPTLCKFYNINPESPMAMSELVKGMFNEAIEKKVSLAQTSNLGDILTFVYSLPLDKLTTEEALQLLTRLVNTKPLLEVKVDATLNTGEVICLTNVARKIQREKVITTAVSDLSALYDD